MKTINTIPKLIAALCILMVLPGLSMAQDADKQVRIKIQKEEIGKKINIDTLINHKDLPAFKEYLSTQGINMNHQDDHEGHKKIIIKTDGEHPGEDIEKHVEIIKLHGEGEKSENVFIMKGDDSENIEWVTDEKATKKLKKRKMKKGEAGEEGVQKIIIIKDGETGEIIRKEIISEDETTGEAGQHDRKIIVKDGKTGEVITEQIISGSDEAMDGKEIKVKVITDDDMSDMQIDGAEGKRVIVIEEEHEIENENGKTKQVFVMIRVEMSDLEEEDINNWVEKGEDQSKLTSTLEANDLSFYPNPNDGNFTLKFSLAGEGKTSVRIVDLSGKEVYSESMENFSGEYEKAIDISEEAKGVYLLQVTQGAETLNKKIVLE